MAVPRLHNEPSALALAADIAAGKLSVVEAVDAAIARIETLDIALNAVVVRDFDRAREAAKLVEKRATKGPLHGVPMTVKESYNIAGLKTTWGFEHARDFVASEDAHHVRKLKQAGAIILGKTNVPVALADVQSVNPIYGRTNNPHDVSRTCGGSSGGGAAALASGMVPLEFGSDIGGSIRTPCHFCGVIGLKPTYGSIAVDGHYYPGMEGAATVLSMTGPMARDVRDLAVALDLTAKLPLPRTRHASLKGVRILVIEDNPLAGLDAPVAAALRSAADAAADAGALVDHRSDLIPDREQMQADYIRMLNIAIAGRMPLDGAPPVSAPEWFAILDKQAVMTRHWERLFEDYDAIFAPVFGTTAFAHDDEPNMRNRTLMINGKAEPFAPQLSWIGLATYPGMPSVSVPVGGHNRLPIGIQVITPHWQDHSALAIAGMIHDVMKDA
jgi:amidase